MALSRTKYPNIERTVAGTVTVDPQDSILNCDTTTAAVTINLDTFTAGYWNTLYKLFVNDSGANAAINNITIVAPAGFTINNAATLVINVNSGSVIVRISADTKYTGDANFDPSVVVDTGWLDLQGFSWITTMPKPQYRLIGKQIVFRHNLVIPLDDGKGSVILFATNPTYGNTYVNTTAVGPFLGSGGVTAFAGGCYFNNGNPVLQSASHYPDSNYTSGWIIATRQKLAQGQRLVALYHSVYILTLTSGGLLRLDTLNSAEASVYAGQQLGNSILRHLNSRSIAANNAKNFNDVVDTMNQAATLNGSLINNYDFPQIKNRGNMQHYTTMDPADETQFGGMQTPLMGFLGYQ